jgi:uncharacterized membrane protein YhhN
VIGLLVAERLDSPRAKWATKPIASGGFVLLAVANGAARTPFGIAITAALVLSWVGDVLLVPKGTGKVFRSGVLAFLGAHLAFGVAFLVRGTRPSGALASLVVLVPLGVIMGAYFVRRATPNLRAPVAAYVVVLSTMVALAAATHAESHAPIVVAGAAAFYLSDVSVALDRFVRPSFVHRAWGVPLYYAAQVLFAFSVG